MTMQPGPADHPVEFIDPHGIPLRRELRAPVARPGRPESMRTCADFLASDPGPQELLAFIRHRHATDGHAIPS